MLWNTELNAGLVKQCSVLVAVDHFPSALRFLFELLFGCWGLEDVEFRYLNCRTEW